MFNTLKCSKFSLICFSDQQNGRKFENSWIMYNLQALLPPSMNCKLDWILWYAKCFNLVLKNKGMLSSSSPSPCFSSWTASTSPPLSCYKCLGIQNGFHKGTHRVCETDQTVVNNRLPYLTNPIRTMTLKVLIVKLIISSVPLISNFQSNSKSQNLLKR